MADLHYRLIFDLVKKHEIAGKNLLKVVKYQHLVEKCCNVWKNVVMFGKYGFTIAIFRLQFPHVIQKYLQRFETKFFTTFDEILEMDEV